MSVLSDRDIRAAIEAGEIGDQPYDPVDLQPSSVDLHLDRSFRVFRNNRYPYIDVRAPQPDLTELLTVADDEPFILHPGEFVLGQTLEWVELPERSRRQARREELAREARAADPLDRGLRRSRLEGQPDPRAVERGEPADRALLRDEDRPDHVLQDVERRSIARTARPELGSKYQGQSEPTASAYHRDFVERARNRATPSRWPSNDAVDWRRDLGGGVRVALIQAGHVPLRRRGAVRAGAADPVGPLVDRRDRPRAPAPPGAQLPAGRDAGRSRARRDRDRRADRRQGPRHARLRGPADRPGADARPASTRHRSTSSR